MAKSGKVGDSIFDLTSEQFKDTILDYKNVVLQSRDTHFKKIEKKERYEYLKKCLMDILK